MALQVIKHKDQAMLNIEEVKRLHDATTLQSQK